MGQGQADAELVRQVYAALNRRDIEGALQHLHAEIAWSTSDRFARGTRVFRGHDGVREVVARFDEALDDFRVEPVALHEAGDVVVAQLRAAGRLRGTGEVIGYDLAQVWTLRDGRALRVDVYPRLEDAWTAAGMTPPPSSIASISSADTGRDRR